ncbi:YfhO family protein [Enterococcus sp. AZ126]|uniref:YfhO family protein n=1 Tax=Enterococcus sp. AZ126 TaxID=2774635 RepID=UPI003F2164FD
MKIKNWLERKGWAFLLSVLIPIGIMVAVYLTMGIYPTSERTVLASDALSQTSNFFASFNNVLHGEQSIFYTWYGSLGLNYWSFMAYYINGIFSFLVVFFDNQHIPDALYFILLLKFGAIGGTFWIMSDRLFKLPQIAKIMLSISFALCGFSIAYSPQQMWLDGLIYLPLVILGIHLLMDERKPKLLFISYLLLFLSNFYMAFMVGVFSFLYVFCRFLTEPKRYKTALLPYLLTSLLAGGASMVTILPTLLDLKNNGEGLTPIYSFLTKDTDIWDIPAKTMVGSYDTSKYGSAPFIYFGLIGLVFCLFYFVSRKIQLRNKLIYGGLFLLLIASVYIEPMNLFWHGMHSPYMFLFRFSFLISFLGLLLAGFGLEKVTKDDVNQLINCMLGLVLLYVLISFVANRKRYEYLDQKTVLFTLSLALVYLLLGVLIQKWPRRMMLISGLFCVIFIGEQFINAQRIVSGIAAEWNYPDRKAYDDHFSDIQTLIDVTKEENTSLYRVGNVDPTSRNESFIHGYSGVTMFSSIRNRHSSQYLDQLGFRSTGTNLTIQYENNTLIMDSLLGIKYNLAKEDLMKYGFTAKKKAGAYTLYENQFALPLGILTDKGIYKKNAVQNQTELLQYLSGDNSSIFTFAEVETIKENNVNVEEQEGGVYYSRTSISNRELTYSVDVPADSQAYLSLYGKGSGVDVITKVNGIQHLGSLDSSGQYYNLGYYKEATTIDVQVVFAGEKVVQLVQPKAMFLNSDRFEKMMKTIQKQGVPFETTGRTAEAKVNLSKEQVVLTTIPYDKGWRAYIDGKRVEIPTFKDAFLALPVPKGKHTVKLVFLPEGFSVGLSLFISCILLFIIYNWWEVKRMKRQTLLKKEKER